METINRIVTSYNKKGLNTKYVPVVHAAVKSAASCQVFSHNRHDPLKKRVCNK